MGFIPIEAFFYHSLPRNKHLEKNLMPGWMNSKWDLVSLLLILLCLQDSNEESLMAGHTRRVATLPVPHTNTLIQGERKRSASDRGPAPHIPEPFQSISAQQLVQENCRHCGMIRKESGRVRMCKYCIAAYGLAWISGWVRMCKYCIAAYGLAWISGRVRMCKYCIAAYGLAWISGRVRMCKYCIAAYGLAWISGRVRMCEYCIAAYGLAWISGWVRMCEYCIAAYGLAWISGWFRMCEYCIAAYGLAWISTALQFVPRLLVTCEPGDKLKSGWTSGLARTTYGYVSNPNMWMGMGELHGGNCFW